MNTNDSLSKGRRILGLAMILAGIFCTISQFANGRLRADFSQGLAYAATVQTGNEMPRVDSAQAQTRAVAGTRGPDFLHGHVELSSRSHPPDRECGQTMTIFTVSAAETRSTTGGIVTGSPKTERPRARDTKPHVREPELV